MLFAKESLNGEAVLVYSARGTFNCFSTFDARTLDGVGMLTEIVGSN